MTSSPSRSSATPEPAAATVPAASVPSAIGAGPPICQLPILTSSSQLPMPAATTSMSTSSAAGVAGSSTSKISTDSPSAVIPATRIVFGARDHALASGDLAATSVEDQIDRTALHDRCAGVSRKLDGDVPNPA